MTDYDQEVARSGTSQVSAESREGGKATEFSTFRSILFPPGLEELRAERASEPACFLDLNLDQVIAAVVAKRDEPVLRPIFYSLYRTEFSDVFTIKPFWVLLYPNALWISCP